jgi:Lar family restriction alleviation protein
MVQKMGSRTMTSPSIKEALEPCPFCGGEAILLKDHKCLGYYVTCKSCFVASATKTKSVAIELWNTRATLQPSGEWREAIARILRFFHRNACYPDALDGEVDAAVTDLLASGLVQDEAGRPYCGPLKQGEALYLALYEKIGAKWSANERQDIWVETARDYERRRRAAIRSARDGGEG